MVKYIEGTTEYVQVAALFQELSRQAWMTTISPPTPHLTPYSRVIGDSTFAVKSPQSATLTQFLHGEHR